MSPHKDVAHETRHQVSNNWRLYAERKQESSIDAGWRQPHDELSHSDKQAKKVAAWAPADWHHQRHGEMSGRRVNKGHLG